MEYVSFKITESQKNKIEEFYQDDKIEISGEYVVFAANNDNAKIIVYSSKKGYSVCYSGINALYEARILFEDAKLNEVKNKENISFIDYNPQIGSDEVGTGDLFGPVIVVACYYSKELNDEIDFSFGDSKKYSDEFILKNIPSIIKKLTFSKYTLSLEKYNSLIEKGFSMNHIKAILHNLALTSLSKKIKYNNAYIDQFCEPNLYYKYLDSANQIPLKNITFHIKGESYYPSCALASMIARYFFLKEMDDLNKKYDTQFPKGAGKNVDNYLNEFIKKYSKEGLKEVAKLNFANIDKLNLK